MQNEIDLMSLTKEQLVHLVQVRGQALTKAADADNQLWDRLASGDIEAGLFEGFMKAKGSIMNGLGLAEEKILAGQPCDVTVN